MPHLSLKILLVSQFPRDNFVLFEFYADWLSREWWTLQVRLSTSTFISSSPKCHNHFIKYQGYVYPNSNSKFYFQQFCKNSTRNSSPILYQIWHHKLGNPHHEALKHFHKLCNIQIPYKSMTDFCNACCIGKVHMLPFNKSIIVYTYFPTSVDAYNRYTLIYPLTLKYHTFTTFI